MIAQCTRSTCHFCIQVLATPCVGQSAIFGPDCPRVDQNSVTDKQLPTSFRRTAVQTDEFYWRLYHLGDCTRPNPCTLRSVVFSPTHNLIKQCWCLIASTYVSYAIIQSCYNLYGVISDFLECDYLKSRYEKQTFCHFLLFYFRNSSHFIVQMQKVSSRPERLAHYRLKPAWHTPNQALKTFYINTKHCDDKTTVWLLLKHDKMFNMTTLDGIKLFKPVIWAFECFKTITIQRQYALHSVWFESHCNFCFNFLNIAHFYNNFLWLFFIWKASSVHKELPVMANHSYLT